jgi:hypothetical protein
MALINCENCGKVFPGQGTGFCPACRDADDQAFNLVKTYLVDNPAASAEQAAEALELDIKLILRMLRTGRLKVKAVQKDLVCTECGTGIDSGIYCLRCGASKGSSDGMFSGDKESLSAVRKTKKGQIHSRRIRKRLK